eukprot:895053_1
MADAEFEIYVSSLTGKTIILYTTSQCTILDLKKKIFEKEGIPSTAQRLIFKSKNLYDENKPISHYGINAGHTLNLVLRLAMDSNEDGEEDQIKYRAMDALRAALHTQDSNKSWYYLDTVDIWKPFEPFISLLLCCRYNEQIFDQKFALFSSFNITNQKKKKEGEKTKRMRYLFELNNDKPHQMFEPQHCVICYGYLDRQTKRMIQCDIPSSGVVNDEVELLYLLNTNQSTIHTGTAQKEHLSLLPHPANPFLFGTWFGELIYAFEWMVNEETKLRNEILTNNIDSLQFNTQYLDNHSKMLFKRMVKNKCGIPFGVGHLLYNHLRNQLRDLKSRPRSSNYVYQVIHQFFAELKHQNITRIQIIFLQNEIHSTDFFNRYLKAENPYISTTKLTHFLKDVLSLRSTQIQQLIPAIKSAFQIRIDDKYAEDGPNARFHINLKRAKSLYMDQQGNKAVTSFNIWLPRNVIYSKKELIKQQNDVKRYIEHHDIDSRALRKMKKKRFVSELHAKAQIPIGPLNVLYDDLPKEKKIDKCTPHEIVEFICNYLDELRLNNIERMQERSVASGITDEDFAKRVAANAQNELAQFLRNTLMIKSNNKITELIPKIQQYTQNLYVDLEIVKRDTDTDTKENKQPRVSVTFGTWLSELCFERSKLTKQQQMMEQYMNTQMEGGNTVQEMDEWQLSWLWADGLKLDPMDAAPLMNALYHLQETQPHTTKLQVIEHFKKVLYDIRNTQMAAIRSTCDALAKQGIDDEYFLHDIVVHDYKLEKFLIHNMSMTRLSEIPQLIHNIRKHLEALHIIQNEDAQKIEEKASDDLRAQTIYGNKIGRWIGEIIHNRLTYLKAAKALHDCIVSNHWDSGILPHVGQQMFLRQCPRGISDVILKEIWKRLETHYINKQNAVAATHTQVAQNVFEYTREIRRGYIYQISLECIKDAECVDAKTFFTKVGSNKTALSNFMRRILKATRQEHVVTVFTKEMVIEQVHYLLSADVDDNNVSVEDWLSKIIYDPVSLWVKTAQVHLFLAEENINAARANNWGKKTFIEKASVHCSSLSRKQLNQLYDICVQDKDGGIYAAMEEELETQHEKARTQCKETLKNKNINKQSFVNVTAMNVDKCIEFLDKDLGIHFDEERELVIGILERLRLCLKIHTMLLDNQFGDEYKYADKLFADADNAKEVELKEDVQNDPQDEKDDVQQHSAWVQHNMLDIKDFNHKQLGFALCYALLQHKQLEQQTTKIYTGFREAIRDKDRQSDEKENERFTFDGEYVTKYIVSANKQNDIDKVKQREWMDKQLEKQAQDPWKYKQGIEALTPKELTDLMEECLLKSECIPYYKFKMDNIAQKIIDSHMNGVTFVTNMTSQNVFMHRMMQCFGDKTNHKLVQKMYDEIHSDGALVEEITKYDAAQLSFYLKTYQMNKLKTMMTESKMNGKRFKALKRHQFATQAKQASDLPLGIATMLYKKMKTFQFMKPVENVLQDEDEMNVSYAQLLRDKPSIEFVSLITKTLRIEDESLCKFFWNEFLVQYDDQSLENKSEREIMQSIYGYPMNAFHQRLLSEINADHGNKYSIAQTLIQETFGWLKEEKQYSVFNADFTKYIAEYFKSDLMLILMYKRKHELLTPDMVRFLLRLDTNHIHYDRIRVLADSEMDHLLETHKKGFNTGEVEGVMREIKVFIRKEKRIHQTHNIASWKGTDISMYLMIHVLNQICLMHGRSILKDDYFVSKLGLLDVLLCIKYFAVFIQEYVDHKDMDQLIESKANGAALYGVNYEVVPQIVSDIFVSWIMNKIPDPSNFEIQAQAVVKKVGKFFHKVGKLFQH